MLCKQANCEGEIENTVCKVCGTKVAVVISSAQSNNGSPVTPPGQALETAISQDSREKRSSQAIEAGSSQDSRDRRSSQPKVKDLDAALKLQKVSMRLKAIEDKTETDAITGKDELLRVSETLTTVVPDKYEAWRAQADLWLAAIHQLEKRQLTPDDSVELMGVPLRENELRDAAEEALRQCAHFAETVEQRIALIDEANKVRRMTWF